MKVHNSLEELLEDFCYKLDLRECLDSEFSWQEVIKPFVSSNSLALGKPRPLAKNKQTNNKLFDCPSQENGICDCTDECTWDFDEIT